MVFSPERVVLLAVGQTKYKKEETSQLVSVVGLYHTLTHTY